MMGWEKGGDERLREEVGWRTVLWKDCYKRISSSGYVKNQNASNGGGSEKRNEEGEQEEEGEGIATSLEVAALEVSTR